MCRRRDGRRGSARRLGWEINSRAGPQARSGAWHPGRFGAVPFRSLPHSPLAVGACTTHRGEDCRDIPSRAIAVPRRLGIRGKSGIALRGRALLPLRWGGGPGSTDSVSGVGVVPTATRPGRRQHFGHWVRLGRCSSAVALRSAQAKTSEGESPAASLSLSELPPVWRCRCLCSRLLPVCKDTRNTTRSLYPGTHGPSLIPLNGERERWSYRSLQRPTRTSHRS